MGDPANPILVLQVENSGVLPGPRFGHTAVWDESTQLLIVAGGSDGSDLLRNGQDLQDVPMWSISSLNGNKVSAVWAPVDVTIPQTCALGRCNGSCVVERNLWMIGGGADSTNNVTVINLDSFAVVPVDMAVAPIERAREPRGRLSHVSWHFGPQLIIQGGWTNQATDECWEIDMSGGWTELAEGTVARQPPRASPYLISQRIGLAQMLG